MNCIVGAIMCGVMHIAGPLGYAYPNGNAAWAYATLYAPATLAPPPMGMMMLGRPTPAYVRS